MSARRTFVSSPSCIYIQTPSVQRSASYTVVLVIIRFHFHSSIRIYTWKEAETRNQFFLRQVHLDEDDETKQEVKMNFLRQSSYTKDEKISFWVA